VTAFEADEYERLFGLAMEDHNRAVTLDPNNAEVYFNRAQTNYDRGTLDLVENKKPLLVNPTTKSWLDAAASDFEKAAEIDPKNSLTLDRLGLTYEQADEEDKAVRAYTQEWALDRSGKQRLTDAYCFFGFRHQQQKELAAAAAAYQKPCSKPDAVRLARESRVRRGRILLDAMCTARLVEAEASGSRSEFSCVRPRPSRTC
jgi:tetratricopeptide (TPR) repeat protein